MSRENNYHNAIRCFWFAIFSAGFISTTVFAQASDSEDQIRETTTLRGLGGFVSSVAFSPDGRYLASGSNDSTITLWDVANRKEITTLKGHSDWVNSVAFSPDGRYLASGSYDNTIKLWDIANRTEITTLKGHNDCVRSVTFSPDGRYLASGSDNLASNFKDHPIKLWDVAKRKKITALKGHRWGVKSVTFSPDGRYLASGSKDGSIKLWDVEQRKEITTLKAGRGWVHSVAFSPDGHYLASGMDKTIKLWDVEQRKEITTLNGHSDWVSSVTFSPDGRHLASGSSDNTIKLWDVANRKEITTLKGHSDWVHSVTFSPDGRYLASGSGDGTIIVELLEIEQSKREHAEWKAKEVENAKSSGMNCYLEHLLAKGPFWDAVGQVFLEKGIAFSADKSHSLRASVLSSISGNIKTITGASVMGVSGNTFSSIPKLWYYPDRNFIFFPEGILDGKKYYNMCYYKGTFYQIPNKSKATNQSENRQANKPESLERGKVLLDQCVTASGGLDSLKKVKSVSTTGTLRLINGQNIYSASVNSLVLFQGKSRIEMTIMKRTTVAVRNGDVGWKSNFKIGEIEEFSPDDIINDNKDNARNIVNILSHSDDPYYQAIYDGEGELSNKAIEWLAIIDFDGETICHLAIDAADHSLAGRIYWGKAETGESVFVETMSDFKTVNGIEMPMKTITTIGCQEAKQMVVKDYTINGEVPANAFDKPSP